MINDDYWILVEISQFYHIGYKDGVKIVRCIQFFTNKIDAEKALEICCFLDSQGEYKILGPGKLEDNP